MREPVDIHGVIPAPVPSLSPTQRAFVEAAEALGATVPGSARPLTELPRLASAELDELVESGLVREAADWRYYVFRSRRAVARAAASPASAGAGGRALWARGRYWRTFLFWLLLLLIPLLLLQLTGGLTRQPRQAACRLPPMTRQLSRPLVKTNCRVTRLVAVAIAAEPPALTGRFFQRSGRDRP